jgi:hypothetical protein
MIAAAVLSLAGAGCGDAGRLIGPPLGGGGGISSGAGLPSGSGSGAGTDTSVLTGVCAEEGEVRECHVLIGKHAGIVNCFNGVQRCFNGFWTECGEGTYSLKGHFGRRAELAGDPGEPERDADGSLEAVWSVVSPLPGLAAGPAPRQVPLNATLMSCNDVCDPTCGSFTEGSYTPTGSSIIGWVSANPTALGNAKGGLVGKGYTEPCEISSDCEFGQVCLLPATGASCAHDKCAVGTALDPTCGGGTPFRDDPCVVAVCAKNPNCCTNSSCLHDPCATGVKLSTNSCKNSDTCINTVVSAAATSYCGSTTWDAGCVTAYAACKGVACPADMNRAWDSSAIDPAVGSMACTDLVHSECGLVCPNTAPACDHDLCATGSGLTAGCSGTGCVTAVCGLSSGCCGSTGSWTQACIDLIPQACGYACASAKGLCASVLPNTTDPKCNSYDLVAGIPCYDTGKLLASTVQSYVPICNRGTVATPAGATIQIDVYNANSGKIPTYPPPSGGSGPSTCTTTTQILPGKCVDVLCTTTKNNEIVVNPPGTNKLNGECDYKNNWTINIDPSNMVHIDCAAPVCSTTPDPVRSLETHLVIEAENSTLMAAGEWTAIRSGINSFLGLFTSSPWSSAKAHAEVGYFPDSATSCTAATCSSPPNCVKTNPGMKLTSGNAGNITSLQNALTTTSQTAAGNNPPYLTALNGALAAAATDLGNQNNASTWNQAVVLILASDMTAMGNNYCSSTALALTGKAAQSLTNSGIRTYVIAVGAAQLVTAQAIAAAGGGKGYYVANDANLATNLSAKLQDIQIYANQACSITLPASGTFDLSGTSVTFTAPNGPTGYKFTSSTATTHVVPTATTLATVLAAGGTYLDACLLQCGTTTQGWCYDDPADPKKVVLCGATCSVMDADPWGSATSNGNEALATYTVNCPKSYMPSSYPLTGPYGPSTNSLASLCPTEGTKPLWSWLAYDTSDPVGTSVAFSFQTTDVVNGVCPAASAFPAAQTYQAVASSVSATGQVCAIGQGGGCPIDLVQKMNAGSLNGPMLADCMNLSIALKPNALFTAIPTVNSFELRYSCPFVQ